MLICGFGRFKYIYRVADLPFTLLHHVAVIDADADYLPLRVYLAVADHSHNRIVVVCLLPTDVLSLMSYSGMMASIFSAPSDTKHSVRGFLVCFRYLWGCRIWTVRSRYTYCRMSCTAPGVRELLIFGGLPVRFIIFIQIRGRGAGTSNSYIEIEDHSNNNPSYTLTHLHT